MSGNPRRVYNWTAYLAEKWGKDNDWSNPLIYDLLLRDAMYLIDLVLQEKLEAQLEVERKKDTRKVC